MYLSEKLKNALKFGYSYEVIWGYTFKKGYIFKDYVDKLYNFRLTFPKSDPRNLSCKLLLNSLYGRFGASSLACFARSRMIYSLIRKSILKKIILNLNNKKDLKKVYKN
jgi:hypothetical protein